MSVIKNKNFFLPRIVTIGDTSLGGTLPVLIQSMTNTNTLNTKATVDQSIGINRAGGHLVRITVPGMREAKNLINIKNEIHKRGFHFPIIADVHFNPDVAEYCARIVEKVRINPGNYTDKKQKGKIDYSNSEYNEELDKIRTRISPLVRVCKEYGTALRIGSNHGSLSDRILNRYGDTPLGMVESSMEFLRICADLNFYNIVVSMKASNIRVMVQATRLLVQKMMQENLCFPVHLGVTEAGESEDGRIKSAIGIGTLLADGIGNTIRVSLTEEPEKEIPVAKKIVKQNLYLSSANKKGSLFSQKLFNPFTFNKHTSNSVENIGGNFPPVVIGQFSDVSSKKTELQYDYFFVEKNKIDFSRFTEKKFIANSSVWQQNKLIKNIFPCFSKDEYLLQKKRSDKINFIKISSDEKDGKFFNKIRSDRTVVLLLDNISETRLSFFEELKMQKILAPVILCKNYSISDFEKFLIVSACDLGSYFVDGFGDGIFIKNSGRVSNIHICKTAFGILQATQARISKIEFISCPTCGRTQFAITQVLKDIKSKTKHLKGIKIAVMGCVVNGPGEMADADFGCVGAGVDKVNLYRGKELVKKNVSVKNATVELLQIINDSI